MRVLLTHRNYHSGGAEIEKLVRNHGVGFFILTDKEPTIHRKKFIQFCDDLIRRKLRVEWGINTRVTDILRNALPPGLHREVARDVGHRTAQYLLSHRIPAAVQAVLRRPPALWAAPLLLRAAARNAWTFAGIGIFATYCRGRGGDDDPFRQPAVSGPAQRGVSLPLLRGHLRTADAGAGAPEGAGGVDGVRGAGGWGLLHSCELGVGGWLSLRRRWSGKPAASPL